MNTPSSYDTTFCLHSTLVYFSWPLYHIAPFRSHILQDIRICSRQLQACIGRPTTLSRPYRSIEGKKKKKRSVQNKTKSFFLFQLRKYEGFLTHRLENIAASNSGRDCTYQQRKYEESSDNRLEKNYNICIEQRRLTHSDISIRLTSIKVHG